MHRFHRGELFDEKNRFLDRAWAHSDLGMNKDAIEECEKLVKANPNDPALCISLGSFYTNNGDIDKAIEWYQVLIKRFPNLVSIYINLGYIYEKHKKRNDIALTCYEKASELDPTDVWVLNNIGVMNQKEGRWTEALSFFERAYHESGQNGGETADHVLHNLAWAHYHCKNYGKALEMYGYLTEKFPEKPAVFGDLGCIKFKLGKYRMALDLFDKASMLEPDNRHYKRQSDLARRKLSSGSR